MQNWGSRWGSWSEKLQIRLLLVWLLLVAALGGVGYRLYYLQITEATDLLEQAQAQQMLNLHPFVPRRSIVDRNSNILAIDQPVYTIYAHPVLFSISQDEMATQLAPILQLDHDGLVKQFAAQQTGILITRNVPQTIANQVRDFGLDGLDLVQEQQRLYPYNDLFAQILGYVDTDQIGQAGLEASLEDHLQLKANDFRISRMGNGSLMPDQAPENFPHQDDLRLKLTLDNRLQRVAQLALQGQLDRYRAKRGAVMVMDVRDGALLALVTLPTYDPNLYYDFDVERFRNWAVSDLYEPGSTFKPINVAIALELGTIHPDDTVYDEGQIYVGGWPIQNHDFSYVGGRGALSITQVLEYSSNVGMVHVVQTLERATYYDWLEKLGIGKALDTDLPYATIGQLKSREVMVGSPIETATAAFGQGLAVTPLKMLQLLAAIANGGRLVSPHVVKGLVDSKDQLQWQPDRPSPRPVFSPETTQKVLKMMESVVANGTGKAAAIKGYRIAGKTGTAQKAENGVYIPGARITSFVGILTVDNPRYVLFAVIDEPQGEAAFGSTVAAPIVKQVMETLVRVSP
jgi:cell division protein FtsI (penicillin-binding protein 3)